MHVRVKAVEFKALSPDPTPADLALLQAEEYGGPSLQASDVRVRQMLLCHDQTDRTFERFPVSYLGRFAETLPGKSVLPGHNTEALPLARFYTATVEQMQEREFPVLIQPEKDGGDPEGLKAELVPGFAPRARRVRWLKGGFYYPADADSAGLDNRIRLGVYRSVSIGFRYDCIDCEVCKDDYLGGKCPHLFGQRLEDGRVVTGIYSGDAQRAEALEGSIVYLGAQPDARLMKSMVQAGAVDPQRLAYTEFGEDLIRLKAAEDLARRYGHQQKSWGLGGITLGNNQLTGAEVKHSGGKSAVISGSPEAIEALLATLVTTGARAESDAPNYRAAGDDPACATCMHYAEGQCAKFDFAADPAMTCDDHEPREMDEGTDTDSLSPRDGATLSPAEGGTKDDPATKPARAGDAALTGDDSMKLLEKLKTLGRISAEATEADAEKALEDLHADAGKATDAETAKTAAEAATATLTAEKAELETEVASLKAAAPLHAIGEKALKHESDRYVAEAMKLGRPEREVAIVAQSFVDQKDYDGLKALADETFAAVCAKYPDRIGRTEQEQGRAAVDTTADDVREAIRRGR